MEFLLGWVAFAALIGWWANEWDRDAIIWGFLALILSPIIAGIALLVTGKNEDSELDKRGLVECPYCAELVKGAAVKCKHCGSDIISTTGAEYLEEQQLLDLIEKLKSGRR